MIVLSNITTFRSRGEHRADSKGLGRGIYTLNGDSYSVTVKQQHTVTADDVASGSYKIHMNIFRYMQDGEYHGAVDTKRGARVYKEGGSSAYLIAGASVTEEGKVTVNNIPYGLDWYVGDVHVIEVEAFGQIPGIPVTFK